MLEIFAVALAIAVVFGLLIFVAAAGFVVICLVAGAGLGGFIVLVIVIKISDKRQEREDRRRAMDRQWMLELIRAARASPSDQSLNEMLTIEQSKPRRLAKR